MGILPLILFPVTDSVISGDIRLHMVETKKFMIAVVSCFFLSCTATKVFKAL